MKSMASEPGQNYPDAHTVLYDHLKKAMLAFFDQKRSNLNIALLPNKEKVNYCFYCFGKIFNEAR